MTKFLPSASDLKEFSFYAVGGIAEEMASEWAKDNITMEIVNKYPIIIHGLMLIVAVMLSKQKSFKEIGAGIGVNAMANIIREGFDMFKNASA